MSDTVVLHKAPPAIWIIGKTEVVDGISMRMLDAFTLGRDESCTIRIEPKVVSRNHAEVFPKEGEWWVRDLGSTNKTFIGEEEVTEKQLVNGCMLRLGKQVEFEIWIEGS